MLDNKISKFAFFKDLYRDRAYIFLSLTVVSCYVHFYLKISLKFSEMPDRLLPFKNIIMRNNLLYLI